MLQKPPDEETVDSNEQPGAEYEPEENVEDRKVEEGKLYSKIENS